MNAVCESCESDVEPRLLNDGICQSCARKQEKRERKEAFRETFSDWENPPKPAPNQSGIVAERTEDGDLNIGAARFNDPVLFEGEIEEQEINEYALFEQQTENYDSNLASKRHTEGGVAVLVERNGKIETLHAVNADLVYERGSDWDRKLLDGGIKIKGVSSYGGHGTRGRSGGKKRFKIELDALKQADNIYVVRFDQKQGGSEGNRSYNNFNFREVIHLIDVEGMD